MGHFSSLYQRENKPATIKMMKLVVLALALSAVSASTVYTHGAFPYAAGIHGAFPYAGGLHGAFPYAGGLHGAIPYTGGLHGAIPYAGVPVAHNVVASPIRYAAAPAVPGPVTYAAA